MSATALDATQNTIIDLTPDAIQALKGMLSDAEEAELGLRFGIQGGGCSGYSYILEFSGPEEGDTSTTIQGVPVHIAPLKQDFLQGTVIDFVDELLETGFKIRNPNVKRECGCGESFDITD